MVYLLNIFIKQINKPFISFLFGKIIDTGKKYGLFAYIK